MSRQQASAFLAEALGFERYFTDVDIVGEVDQLEAMLRDTLDEFGITYTADSAGAVLVGLAFASGMDRDACVALAAVCHQVWRR